jgi:lysophospholipase L1-like esterase
MNRNIHLLAGLALAVSSISCSGSDAVTGARSSLSSDATLSALTVSAGSLTPAFARGTTQYTLAVPFRTSSLMVTPKANDTSVLSVGVRQDNLALFAVSSQQPGIAVAVPALGAKSTVTVRVTAEDGSFGNYTIALTQSPRLDSDSSLKSLAPGVGSLVPAFDPGTFVYSLAVPNGTATLTLASAANDASALSVQAKQDAGSFGTSTTFTVPPVGSSSAITVEVTAQDGTRSDYQITLTQLAPVAPAALTIYSIGDSTMAPFTQGDPPDKVGWGQQFQSFVVGSDVAYVNKAKNGASSRSFYDGGSWTPVKTALKPGDYVLIQFAHNDESDNGLDGTDGIGTAPFALFTQYLGKYVDETIAAGANPILVTPVVRRNFSGNTLTLRGKHDLTGTGDPSIPAGTDLNYVEAMKAVATAKSVPVVDLTAATQQLVEQFGSADAKAVVYITEDDTHLQATGATMFAQLAVQGLVAQNLLTSHLDTTGHVYGNPASLSYGSVFTNQTADKTITVTGLSLTPASGNVTVSVPSGFLVAASASGTFASSVQLPYTGGELAPIDIVVRFAPSAGTTYSGSVSITPPTGAPQSVAVSGTGNVPTTGGQDTSVVYSLTADGTCATTGLATCVPQFFNPVADAPWGIYARDFLSNIPADGACTAPPCWLTTGGSPATPANTTVQRISILTSPPTTADQWPGNESGPIANRWVQYAVSPAPGKSWTLDTISFYVGTLGGSNMGYVIDYSVNDTTFTNAVTLIQSGFTKDIMTLQSFPMTLTLAPGDTLYVRAHPWLKGTAAATGKYLVLQSLTVHGNAQ